MPWTHTLLGGTRPLPVHRLLAQFLPGSGAAPQEHLLSASRAFPTLLRVPGALYQAMSLGSPPTLHFFRATNSANSSQLPFNPQLPLLAMDSPPTEDLTIPT